MKTATLLVPIALTLFTCSVVAQDESKPRKIGYSDTPIIPGQKWHVHDGDRPQPRKVKPATASTQKKAGEAPSDAVVLFDGKNLSKWTGRRGEAKWKLEDGAMIVNGTGDVTSVEKFGDCQLHIEWMVPTGQKGQGQGLCNSGVFFFGRYEIQVLNSHDTETYPDGQAAALYGQQPPAVNACRPAGEWQTYDIVFTAPRFANDGKLENPAYATVLHNGVLVHNHQKILGATAHRAVAKYTKHGEKGPIKLQDHGNPVRYRNIWVRDLSEPRQAPAGHSK